MVLAAVLMLAACGSDTASDASSATSQPEVTTASSAPTTTAEPATSSSAPATSEAAPADIDGVDPQLIELFEIVEDTVLLPRLEFELEINTSLNGDQFDARTIRTGWFDDDSLAGEGTLSIFAGDVVVGFGSPPFETRVIDEQIWTFDPLAEPPAWSGIDIFDVITSTGGDPTASVDGDLILITLADAMIDLDTVVTFEDGRELWRVNVDADAMVSAFAAGGPVQRITALGGADTGIVETAGLLVEDGLVIDASADLSRWWTEVQRIAAESEGFEVPRDEDDASWRITLTPFDEVRTTARPCATPTSTDQDGITVRTC